MNLIHHIRIKHVVVPCVGFVLSALFILARPVALAQLAASHCPSPQEIEAIKIPLRFKDTDATVATLNQALRCLGYLEAYSPPTLLSRPAALALRRLYKHEQFDFSFRMKSGEIVFDQNARDLLVSRLGIASEGLQPFCIPLQKGRAVDVKRRGNLCAMVVRDTDNTFYTVVGKQKGKRYPHIDLLTVAPSRVAYRVSEYRIPQKLQQFVVLDGKELKRYDGVEELMISPNGKHFAYATAQNLRAFVVFDGKEWERQDGIYSLTFSPDSARFAYVINRNNRSAVVVDGTAGKWYDGLSVNNLSFSPDSAHVVYTARTGRYTFVVLDGKESEPFDAVSSLAFAPDGTSVWFDGRKQTTTSRIVLPMQ